MTDLVNIADIVNPETGKTFRQENEEMTHNIPIGTLVDVKTEDGDTLRLYVVDQIRDFDGSPLYALSFDKNWSENMFGPEYRHMAMARCDFGYPEESLTIINIR